MRLADIDYHLPMERIAQVPVEPRDAARLLVDQGAGEPLHRHVSDIVDHLREGDVLVVNDTRVLPARLYLQRRTGGAVEVLLLEPRDSEHRQWEAMIRPARKMKAGETLFVGGEPVVQVGGRIAEGNTFSVEITDDDPLTRIAMIGSMPLPPYITTELQDRERYQTVYARDPASAAAPTAGLHFTPELLDRIVSMGVGIQRVELIVGLDTFKPVVADDPRDHVIHTERYHVEQEVLDACREAQRVVAVGTTATRALESAATTGQLSGRTNLFITRGYEWKCVDLLMTNFHMPRTSLLLLIDAFMGERWRRLYEVALANEYRFLSFGDAMLLNRHL